MPPINAMRRAVARAMTDKVSVLRKKTTEVVAGYPRTVEVVAGQYPCLVVDLSAQEQIVANQAGYRANAKIVMPWNTDVTPADRLQVGFKVYMIQSLNEETSLSLKTSTEAMVTRVGASS